jgi:hypothetical protein
VLILARSIHLITSISKYRHPTLNDPVIKINSY